MRFSESICLCRYIKYAIEAPAQEGACNIKTKAKAIVSRILYYIPQFLNRGNMQSLMRYPQ